MATTDPLSALRGALDAAAAEVRGGDGGDGGPSPALDRPPRPEMGDYSSNAAMLLAAPLGESPRAVAERLVDAVGTSLGDRAERVEVAGPGFVNLHLADGWYADALAALGTGLEVPPIESPERILVEFVSANPTGPLTAAGGRHAAYGDSLARILEAAGHEVGREYYVNDAGGQIQRFGASIAAAITGSEPPEDAYEGGYIAEIGTKLAERGADPADTEALALGGVELMLEQIRASLHGFGVEMDDFFSERSLNDGRLEATLERLRESGHIYESDGATWLRTTTFGDDKDRVLVRATGEPTYLAPDLAYHADKLNRGWTRMLDVWGADHHGYVDRERAGLEALGADPESFEVVIMQLVHLIEGGERAQMSKRRGDFVTLDDLVADIGVDAARYFMVQRSHDTTIDLDLDLARSQSSDNPVYYVQYAHARIASILRKAADEGAGSGDSAEASGTAFEPSERNLIKRLLEFPSEVAEAAARRSPHRLCAYANATAADFHAFYRDCQVIGTDPALERRRLDTCSATQATIARTLGLLGISAPDRM